jgi:DMSO/TMAO reductase YedYZ heme-binding membrane subunit
LINDVGSASGLSRYEAGQLLKAETVRAGTYRTPPRALGLKLLVWTLRAAILAPLALMTPEVVSALQGRPDAVAHLSASTADVLGTSSFLLFVMMLTVTPIHTVTGWRWHLILRRDFGVGMFVVAATDLTLAATTTGDTFQGGFLTRLFGHTFLAVGSIAVLLSIPLAITATARAKHWLGKHWRWTHRLTYIVWAMIMLHLLLLFGFHGFFLRALALSVPLASLRVPAVRRWWANARRARAHRVSRVVAALALLGVFAAGFTPFVMELAHKGPAAFVHHPIDD